MNLYINRSYMTKCVTIVYMEGGCSSLWVLTYLTFFRLPHILVTLGATLKWNGWIVKICWIARVQDQKTLYEPFYWCSTISPIQSPWIHWPPGGFKLLITVVIVGNNVKAAVKTGCLKKSSETGNWHEAKAELFQYSQF